MRLLRQPCRNVLALSVKVAQTIFIFEGNGGVGRSVLVLLLIEIAGKTSAPFLGCASLHPAATESPRYIPAVCSVIGICGTYAKIPNLVSARDTTALFYLPAVSARSLSNVVEDTI